MQSIDNNVLCIISHNKSGENCLKKIPLKHTLPYKGKQINVVIYVHYGGEGDVIEFFDFVKKRLARIWARMDMLVSYSTNGIHKCDTNTNYFVINDEIVSIS